MKVWSAFEYCARRARLFRSGFKRTMSSCENAQLQSHILADEMPLLRKQVLLSDAENLGKEFNLFAIHRAPQGFDIGDFLSRHVDVAQQMQMSNEVILRPAPLIAQPCDLSSNYICVFHPSLRQPALPPVSIGHTFRCIKSEIP